MSGITKKDHDDNPDSRFTELPRDLFIGLLLPSIQRTLIKSGNYDDDAISELRHRARPTQIVD